jgi:hypothetical protein
MAYPRLYPGSGFTFVIDYVPESTKRVVHNLDLFHLRHQRRSINDHSICLSSGAIYAEIQRVRPEVWKWDRKNFYNSQHHECCRSVLLFCRSPTTPHEDRKTPRDKPSTTSESVTALSMFPESSTSDEFQPHENKCENLVSQPAYCQVLKPLQELRSAPNAEI